MCVIDLNPVEWLCEQDSGFAELRTDERDAIMHFALIWTYFEAKVCKKDADATMLLRATQRWCDEQLLDDTMFSPSLNYFRQRYIINGNVTAKFDGLNLPDRDCPPVVEVLLGERTTVQEIAYCLLLIVYRLRNNLFHGEKWEDGLNEQLDLFTNAITILKLAVNLDRRTANRN